MNTFIETAFLPQPPGLDNQMRIPVSIMALLLFTAPAMAQPICAERTDVLKQLQKAHSEAPTALGTTASGLVVELLSSDTGSWTLIATRPSGVSCLIAAGENWQPVEQLAEGPAT